MNSKMQLCSIAGYENLKLYQPSNCFRMTSDSLALANFVKINYRDHRILDIGTGLGGIPLILSTKGNAHITGVEIDDSIANYARESVRYNNLEEKIHIVHDDIKNYSNNSDPNIYDIIVSNPPYYAVDKGYINSCDSVATARHDQCLNVEDIFLIAKKLLKDQGRLVLVFTTDRFIEILNLYQKYHLSVKKIQFLYGKVDKESKVFLIEGTKNGKPGTRVCPPLILSE